MDIYLTSTCKMIYNRIMNKNDSHNVQELQREVSMLRSAVISIIGRDDEGVYKPEFVKEILEAATETPQYHFRGKNSFLADLARV